MPEANTPSPAPESPSSAAGLAGALVGAAARRGLFGPLFATLGKNSIGAGVVLVLMTWLNPPPPATDGPAAPAVDLQGNIVMTSQVFETYRSVWIAVGEKRAIDRLAGILPPPPVDTEP